MVSITNQKNSSLSLHAVQIIICTQTSKCWFQDPLLYMEISLKNTVTKIFLLVYSYLKNMLAPKYSVQNEIMHSESTCTTSKAKFSTLFFLPGLCSRKTVSTCRLLRLPVHILLISHPSGTSALLSF